MNYDYYYSDDVKKDMESSNNGGNSGNIGLAVASMVLGIIAILSFLFFINIFLAVIAIVLGIVHLNTVKCQNSGRGMAIAGIVTGGVSILLTIGVYMLLFSVASDIESPFPLEDYDYYDDFDDYYDYNYYNDFLEEFHDTL